MVRKYSLITLLVLLSLAVFTSSPVSANALKDVPKESAAEINYLIDNKIITGYPDGTFQPKKNVTRAEAAKMIVEAKGLTATKKSKSSFSDVSTGFWASPYIEAAKSAGIINGYPDGTYKPNANIKRGETAIIISNAYNLSTKDDVFFADVPKGHDKYDAISRAATAGIINGYPDGSFKPSASVTREQIAVMIARAMNDDFKVQQTAPTKKYVNASALNVRSGPGTSYSVVGSLPRDAEVLVHSDLSATWVYISSGNLKGYVSKSYLADKPSPPAPDPTPTPKPGTRVVALDAGHGGSDPGSSGFGLLEKDVNLDVSKRVQKKLESAGVKVVMTRTTDVYIKLEDRVPIAVNAGADTFVSIHANAHDNSSANGTETYYSTASLTRADQSKKLAEFINTRLVTALKTSNRGVKTAGFRVIKTNPLPAALVELAFITNKADNDKLASSTYKDAAADAIAKGIIDYYNWRDKQ